MSRPLIQRSVSDLEALFANSKSDVGLLKQLEHELQHRQTTRAVALLAEVRVAIRCETPALISSKGSAAPQQKGLWEQSPTPTVDAAMPVSRAGEPVAAAAVPAKLKNPPDAAPSMSLEDAYQLLKMNNSSAWESIEQARRQIVERSHPARLVSMSPEHRVQALEEAKVANTAYALLSRARCSRN
jgi:hypothetical protein